MDKVLVFKSLDALIKVSSTLVRVTLQPAVDMVGVSQALLVSFQRIGPFSKSFEPLDGCL